MKRSIEIGQISAGWIQGKITDGKSTAYFCNSQITNFLDDFMLALLTILGEHPADEHKEVFRTMKEPTASVWRVSVSSDDCITVHIDTYSSMEYKDIIHKECFCFEKSSFLQDVIAEMERILNQFGLYGYRLEWGFEFPLSLFLKLKSIADESNTLSVSEIAAADNQGIEASCSSFAAECRIIENCR